MTFSSFTSRFNSAAHENSTMPHASALANPLTVQGNLVISNQNGHILMPDRYLPQLSMMTKDQAQLGESLMDTYSALSCIQDLGVKKAQMNLDILAAGRAFDFIRTGASETAGFSTIALDQLVCDAASLNINKLSPGDMLALAERYVKQTALTEDEAFDTYCNFIEFKREFKSFNAENIEPLKQLAEITLLTPPASAAFHAGARVLDGFMTTQPTMLTSYYIGKTTCTGDDWSEIKGNLKKRTDTLPDNHALKQALSHAPAAPTAQPQQGLFLGPMGLG